MNDKKLQELALAVIETEARAIDGLAREIRQPSTLEDKYEKNKTRIL